MSRVPKSKFDRVVFPLACLVLVVSVYFLLHDEYFEAKTQHLEKQKLGSIAHSQKDVRRKSENELNWRDATNADEIFDGDSIFTGGDSSVEVQLDTMGTLQISANSLVKIKNEKEGFFVNLEYGSLAGKVTGESKIHFEGQDHEPIVATDAEIKIVRKRQSKKIEVRVVSGQLSVQENGKTRILKKDQSFELIEAPVAKPVAIVETPPEPEKPVEAPPPPPPPPVEEVVAIFDAPKLQNPNLNLKMTDANSIPEMKWMGDAKNSYFKLSWARKKDFSDAVVQDIKDASSFQLPLPTPGNYYWKVSQINSKDIESPESEIGNWKIELPAPEPTLTARIEREYKTEDELLAAAVTTEVKWSEPKLAERYEIEFSKDKKFEKSKKFTTKKSKYDAKLTKPGSLFWHVRVVDEKGEALSEFSKTETLVYSASVLPPPPPPAPAPVAPPRVPAAIGKVYPKALEPSSGTSLVALGKAPAFINFRWKALKGINVYQLEISDDPEFNSKIHESRTQGTSYVFEKQIPEGQLYWRVKGVAEKEDGRSGWSKPIPFSFSRK